MFGVWVQNLLDEDGYPQRCQVIPKNSPRILHQLDLSRGEVTSQLVISATVTVRTLYGTRQVAHGDAGTPDVQKGCTEHMPEQSRRHVESFVPVAARRTGRPGAVCSGAREIPVFHKCLLQL